MTKGFWIAGSPAYEHWAHCTVLASEIKAEDTRQRRYLARQLALQRCSFPPDVDGLPNLDAYIQRFGAQPFSKRGLNLCRGFVAACRKRPLPRDGFTLCGTLGSGKSTLMLAVARTLALQGVDVRWESGPRLYSRLLAASRNGDLDDEIRRLIEFPVLAIDDLGREKPTAWWIDQVLFPLVDQRYSCGRPLLVTTNYDWDDLAALYETARSAGGEVAHSVPQLIDRLQHRSAAVTFGAGDSFRVPDWTFMTEAWEVAP